MHHEICAITLNMSLLLRPYFCMISLFCFAMLRNLGKRVLSLIAQALNVNEDFFEEVGAFNPPGALLRPMHYPGKPIWRFYFMVSLPVKCWIEPEMSWHV